MGVAVGLGVRVGVSVTVGVTVGAAVAVFVAEAVMVGVAAGALAPQADRTRASAIQTISVDWDSLAFMAFSFIQIG